MESKLEQKLYDYNGIIDAFNQRKQDIINQSKGRARMVNLPKIRDYYPENNLDTQTLVNKSPLIS